MNTCKNCGAAFDGKFCPECGAKWEETVACPHCGAPLTQGARFCSECGNAIANQPSNQTDNQTASVAHSANHASVMRKIYAVLRYVPAALFALYSVLLFAFMGGQVAVLTAFGMTEKGGNAYSAQIHSNVPNISGAIVALKVFAVLGILFAALLALSIFWAACKGRRLTWKSGRAFLLQDVLSAVTYVWYFVYLVLSAVIMGKVNAFGKKEMGGLIGAGAGPKLILAFAVIFAALAAGAMLGRWLLGKKYPQEIAEEKEQIESRCVQATALWDSARKERAQKGKPALAWAHSYVRLRRAVQAYFLYMLIIQVCIFGIIGNFLGFSVARLVYVLNEPYWIFFLPLLFTVVGIGIAVIAFVSPIKNWTPYWVGRNADGKKGRHCSDIRRFAGFVGAAWMMIDLWFGFTRGEFGSDAVAMYVVLATMSGWIVCAGGVLLGCFADARRTAVANHYYGNCKPKERKQLLVPFDPAQESQNYAAYRAKKETYAATTIARAGKGKAAACVGLAFLLGAITLSVVMPSTMNIFSASYVQKMSCISYGSATDKSYMQRYFGKPDVIKKAEHREGDINGWSSYTYYVWEYYGNKKYRVIAKEANELEREAYKLTAENFHPSEADIQRLAEIEACLSALDQKAAGMQSTYLCIDWENTYPSITLDTKYRHGGGTERKQVKKVQLIGEKKFDKHQLTVNESTNFETWSNMFDETFAKVWYTDGSYRLSAVPHTAFTKLQNTDAGEHKIAWSDTWGEYTATVKVTD